MSADPTLENLDRLPQETAPVLREHVGALVRALGDKLVGVYVHGSAAMGGFNPQQSDLDYIVIVSSGLGRDERQKVSAAFLDLHGKSGFKKGVEMSIVQARFAGADFRYPTPYEFHMGTPEQVRHHGEPHETEHIDPDLASHFTVIRERGVCVFGVRIPDVFASIDRRFYEQSNANDRKHARELVLKDPVYVILNLCRGLYELRDNAVYSKTEGARLYLAGSSPDCDLVQKALADYESGNASAYEQVALVCFVERMLGEISAVASSRGAEGALSSSRRLFGGSSR